MRERDESGKVWSWPEGGSTDFEDDDGSPDAFLAGSAAFAQGGLRAQRQQRSASAGGGQGGQGGQRRQLETQPFPPQALEAARRGAALAAEQVGLGAGAPGAAGLPPLAARAALRPGSSSSSSSSSSGGGSKVGKSRSGGAAAPAVHVYPFGLDGAGLEEIAASLGVGASLAVAERLQDADAVLALRSKIKTSEWEGARERGGGPAVGCAVWPAGASLR